jgi:hypothetical protein
MTSLSFINPSLTHQFEQDGFVVIRGIAKQQALALAAYVNAMNLQLGHEIYYSLMSNSGERNSEIGHFVQDAMADVLKSLFSEYQAYNPSFLVKPAQVKHEFALHQDWCFTDTTQFTMGTVWMPLCDVDETNGCLTVVPKSQKAFNPFISGNLQTARINKSELPSALVTSVPMQLGDVMVFNPLVFHGSYPNTSANARAIATINVLPNGAPFCYHNKTSDTSIDQVVLDNNAILNNLPAFVAGRMPLNSKLVNIPYTHAIPTAHQLVKRMEEI